MTLQPISKDFYSDEAVKRKVTEWAGSNQLLFFDKVVPLFFERLSRLNWPTDVWFTRDILYNAGKDVLEKDETLAHLASVLPDGFVTQAYSEFRGERTVIEFMKRLNSIAAEIQCAKFLTDAGAENVKKCEEPEDISCTFLGARLGFQVKLKSNEDFAQGLIREAILGEMCRRDSEVLREYSDCPIRKCVGLRGHFLSDSMDYIHNHLCNHLRQGYGSNETASTRARLIRNKSGNFSLAINGAGDYEGSVLGISFQRHAGRMLPDVKIAREDQRPDKNLWALIDTLINDIRRMSDQALIGWIRLDMTFQYSYNFSSRGAKQEISDFLEKHDKPLVLLVEVRYDEKPHRMFLNQRAMSLPLVKKIYERNEGSRLTTAPR